jgi:hypothetical protein
MGLLVCAACGHPDCFEGLALCEDALRSGVVLCSCDWGEGDLYVLTAIDPHCPAHGGDES